MADPDSDTKPPFDIEVIKPASRRFILFLRTRQECAFEVLNSSGKRVEGRVRLAARPPEKPPDKVLSRLFGSLPQAELKGDWLSLTEVAEQSYGPPDPDRRPYHVVVKVPARTPPGMYGFSVDVADTENPDERFLPGPVVTFYRPAFPWLLLVALVAVLLLGSGYWALSLPDYQAAITARQGEFVAGEPISYQVAITNTGGVIGRRAVSARDIGALTLTLDGASGSSAMELPDPGAATCTGEKDLRCTLPPETRLEPGKAYTISLRTRTDPAQTGVLTHTLALKPALGHRAAPPRTFSARGARRAGLDFDWAVSGTNPPDAARADGILSYAITVTNSGPSQSAGATLDLADLVENNPRIAGYPKFECPPPARSEATRCVWTSLGPGTRQLVKVSIVPGIREAALASNAVTLTEALSQPVSHTIPLSVSREHGLSVQLTGPGDKATVKIPPDGRLSHTIKLTNAMPFRVTGVQIEFQAPAQFRQATVGWKGVSFLVPLESATPDDWSRDGKAPCWGFQTSGAAGGYRVRCAIGKLDAITGTETITVSAPAPTAGYYDSAVTVSDEQGFDANDSLRLYADFSQADEQHFGLRLDRQVLQAQLPMTRTQDVLGSDFRAEVEFYYDGSTEGRILGVDGKAEPDGFTPGWSIDVRAGVLTMGVRAKDQNSYRYCFLVPPDGSAGAIASSGWYSVTMNVDRQLALAGSLADKVTAEGRSPVSCVNAPAPAPAAAPTLAPTPATPTTPVKTPVPTATPAKTPAAASTPTPKEPTPTAAPEYIVDYGNSATLSIGGNRIEGAEKYRGAVTRVKLVKLNGGIEEPFAEWLFGKEEAVGQREIRNSSPDGEVPNIVLPAGTWAWAPVSGPVLMPVQIVTDSSWYGMPRLSGDWGAPDYAGWSHAWEMPPPPDWVSRPVGASWIWAAQDPIGIRSKLVSAAKASCSSSWDWGGAHCDCTPACECYNDSFPPVTTVGLKKVIEDLPAAPVIATARFWADDACNLYVNRVRQAACASQRQSDAPLIQLNNLVAGQRPNAIAIDATNSGGGPAGVLGVIDIDFYQTYPFGP